MKTPVGQELGVSDWLVMIQECINTLAEVMHDHQCRRSIRQTTFHLREDANLIIALDGDDLTNNLAALLAELRATTTFQAPGGVTTRIFRAFHK